MLMDLAKDPNLHQGTSNAFCHKHLDHVEYQVFLSENDLTKEISKLRK